MNTTRRLVTQPLPPWLGKRTRVGALDFTVSPDLIAPRFALDNHGEKFMDPWVTLGGHTHTAGTGPDRDYLFVLPQDGAVRVDAMIAKVAGVSGDTYVMSIDDLQNVGDILSQQVDAEALRTRSSVWRSWDYLASKSSNLWVQWGLDALKWVTTTFDLGRYGASGKAHAEIEGDMQVILAGYGGALEKGYPYPWQAFSAAPIDQRKLSDAIAKTKDSLDDAIEGIKGVIADTATTTAAISQMDGVAASLDRNLKRFDAMSPDDAVDAINWWAMLLAHLKDPEIARIFAAMHGGMWGAMNMASDEQVLVVAAVVAKAYDLPIRDVAIELWNRSLGWNGDPKMLLGEMEIGLSDDLPYGWNADPNFPKSRVPTNATEVQWVQLARNAIVIASAMKEGDQPPVDLAAAWRAKVAATRAEPEMPVGMVGQEEGAPIAFGAFGSVVLYMAGASAPVVAIPAAVGLALYGIARWARKRVEGK